MAKDNISPATHIIINGARQHNLKNIDLTIPKNKLVVFTGLSGSGKSSLAFDTIYAEGQRKYVESLSSYARQFLGMMQKPDVDQIDGLSPAISIDQKTTSHNPRSTVGTITEIYDYLRLLFARIGHPNCPDCGTKIAPQTVDQMAEIAFEHMLETTSTQVSSRWMILSPVVTDKKGEFSNLLDNLRKKGFTKVRIDGRMYDLSEEIVLIKTNRHSIAVVVERFSLNKSQLKEESTKTDTQKRLRRAFEQASDLSDGLALLSQIHDKSLTFPQDPRDFTDQLFSQHLACPSCNKSFSELEPRLFSFNTPHGACPNCTGLGKLLKIDTEKIIAPELTLTEGSIIPMANALSSDSWYARKVKAILEEENVPVMTPWKDLPKELQNIFLRGSGKTYRVEGQNKKGGQASFTFEFEGFVNELERRYQETNSDYMRREIGKYMQKVICSECNGARLKKDSLSVTITDRNIADVTGLPIKESLVWAKNIRSSVHDHTDQSLNTREKEIAKSIIREVVSRLEFLNAVGLEYLTLGREASTLAGGEAQRIRLASQIGTGLTGVLYVLDEPTIGLHQRDNDRLIETLLHLKNLGNTVVVVEHDEAIMRACDMVVDFGPLAGVHGGEVVYAGSLESLLKNKNSLTGQYLSGKKSIDPRTISRLSQKLHPSLVQTDLDSPQSTFTLKNAHHHNLKNIDVEFPLGKLIVISGVSGSGKSTLMHDTLYPALKFKLGGNLDEVSYCDGVEGAQDISKVHLIDQSPIGRTPRSNPATYTKVFDHIRQVFAATKEARVQGFKAGRFSFNVKGGRCEACQGGGEVKISMQFLSDIYVTCEVCAGKRYNAQTLEVTYKGKNIAEVLDMTVEESLKFFSTSTALTKKLATLNAVGLGYIKLGQPAPTLSGGEAQRVKLAKELSINSLGHNVYLLDEPTTGLHFEDIKKLLVVIKQLVNQNNTVILIEHNLDVIANAQHIIDLGPEGGQGGGQILITGTPREVAEHKESYTGKYLREYLKSHKV